MGLTRMPKLKNNRFHEIGFALSLMAEKKKEYVFLFVGGVFVTLLEMFGVGLVFPFILLVLSPEYLFSKLPESFLDSAPFLVEWSKNPGWLLLIICFVMIFKNGCMLLFHRYRLWLLSFGKASLSYRLKLAYLQSDYEYYLKKSQSEIIHSLSTVSMVYDLYIASLINLTINLMLVIGLGGIMVSVLPDQIWYVPFFAITFSVLFFSSFRNRIKVAGNRVNDLHKKRQSLLRQSIGMIIQAKLLRQEKYFLGKYHDVEKQANKEQDITNLVAASNPLVLEFLIICSILIIVYYLFQFAESSEASVASLAVMAAGMFRITPPMNKVLVALQLISNTSNTVSIIRKDFDNIEIQHDLDTEIPPISFDKEVKLEQVSYSYPNSHINVIKDIDLTIRKGEMVGITGISGSGKSTLAAVIMGFLKPQKGKVSVDKQTLDHPVITRAWHSHIGYVPQSTYLIEDTIAHNIALGIADDEIDETRIRNVLQRVGLKKFVDSLPENIHHFVGEDGARLSGGQRQRISIARMLYFERDMILMDEATSSLDAHNEKKLYEAIETIRKDKAFVIITHKINTLKHCDHVVLLDDGQIIDQGCYDDLVQNSTAFRNLISTFERLQSKS